MEEECIRGQKLGLGEKRNKEYISEEEDDFGVLCSGRRYKRLNIEVYKGESHSDFERREPWEIVQIIKIPHLKGEEENY